MLHVFYGPDSFSCREALQQLKAELDSDGMLANSTVAYEAKDVTPQEVIAACESVPFLSSHRLVVLQGLLQHTAAGGQGRRRRSRSAGAPGGAGSWQALVDCVDRMPPTTTLVVVDGDAPAGPLLETLETKGRVRHFRPPHQRELPGWVRGRAQALGLRLDGRAATLLAELVGPDLWMLSTELQKLAAYAAGRPVREEDVLVLVSAARELEVWGLLDAVVEGRPAAALKALRRLLEQGRNPSYILAMLQHQYRRLALAREMLDQGAAERRVAGRFGLREFALERMLEQAGRHPLPRIRAAFRRLLEADASIKRGIYDEDLALELVVQDLASTRPAAGAA